MIEVHYGVVKIENRWMIIGKGLRLGAYDTKADAVAGVRRIADRVAGRTVRIHVQDEDGSFHLTPFVDPDLHHGREAGVA